MTIQKTAANGEGISYFARELASKRVSDTLLAAVEEKLKQDGGARLEADSFSRQLRSAMKRRLRHTRHQLAYAITLGLPEVTGFLGSLVNSGKIPRIIDDAKVTVASQQSLECFIETLFTHRIYFSETAVARHLSFDGLTGLLATKCPEGVRALLSDPLEYPAVATLLRQSSDGAINQLRDAYGAGDGPTGVGPDLERLHCDDPLWLTTLSVLARHGKEAKIIEVGQALAGKGRLGDAIIGAIRLGSLRLLELLAPLHAGGTAESPVTIPGKVKIASRDQLLALAFALYGQGITVADVDFALGFHLPTMIASCDILGGKEALAALAARHPAMAMLAGNPDGEGAELRACPDPAAQPAAPAGPVRLQIVPLDDGGHVAVNTANGCCLSLPKRGDAELQEQIERLAFELEALRTIQRTR